MNRKDQLQDDVNDFFTEMMHQCEVPDFIIYAFRKTGRIVTEKNKHLLSKKDLEEWHGAIDEFMAANGATKH